MQQIKGYHAHVYFDAGTIAQARALCEQAAQLFPLKMGRVHERPVGPHPDWSCQLAFCPELIGDVLPWLALNRKGLVVFLHPDTGDDLLDHTDHAIWMGGGTAAGPDYFLIKCFLRARRVNVRPGAATADGPSRAGSHTKPGPTTGRTFGQRFHQRKLGESFPD